MFAGKARTYLSKAHSSGLYYKPMTILYDNARIVNKLDASLTDNARVIIYDRHMFIVQANGDITLPPSLSTEWCHFFVHIGST